MQECIISKNTVEVGAGSAVQLIAFGIFFHARCITIVRTHCFLGLAA